MEIDSVEYKGSCSLRSVQCWNSSLVPDRRVGDRVGSSKPLRGEFSAGRTRYLQTARTMTDADRKLEVYKTFVETIIASENRRQQVSTIYLGMVVAVSTVAGAVEKIELIYPASIVLVLSTVWFLSVRYFRKLAHAKFFVISEIEKDIPIAAFQLEWNKLKSENGSQVSLTYLEMSIPVMLGLLCIGYILFRIIA